MKALITALFCTCAGPAVALSCLPQDLNQTFQDAAQSEDAFVVVLGKVLFKKSQLPKTDFNNQQATKPDNLISARIQGRALNHDGFVVPFNREIVLNVQCYGPWCSSMEPGKQYLTFLRKANGGYLLETNPCGGFAISQPSKKTLEQVKACFRGEECKPAKF